MKYIRLVMMLALSVTLLSGCYWYVDDGYGPHRGHGYYYDDGHREYYRR
jgi:hypothetical protein